jgi:dTDP-4-amino-4,6-dideoxygalactose transaminase
MDLETELCRFTGKRYCVACASGSAALYLAFVAYEKEGGRAVIPASTFPAIREAATLAGLRIEYADINPENWRTDFDGPDGVDFICPVHNYGVVGTHGMCHCVSEWRDQNAPAAKIIVDAAAALLTPNAFDEGDAWCLSFNWNKSVSGGGGGALLIDDPVIADRAHQCKRHGGFRGFNFQCPGLCAAEALSELLESDARRRHLKELSLAYDLELYEVGLPSLPHGRTRWLTGTMLRSHEQVDAAIKAIADAGMCARRPWVPLADVQIAPNAYQVWSRGIMLPGGYEIDQLDVRMVCEILGGL